MVLQSLALGQPYLDAEWMKKENQKSNHFSKASYNKLQGVKSLNGNNQKEEGRNECKIDRDEKDQI